MVPYVISTLLTGKFAACSLALARSVVTENPDAVCHLYCLDQEAYRFIAKLVPDRVKVFDLTMFSHAVSGVADIERLRAERTISAFCWTLKPLVVEHAMSATPGAEWYAFADSDMLVMSDPMPRFAAARERSAIVTPHAFRYPIFWGMEHIYGHFNAGFIAFRSNSEGRRMLEWWRNRCLAHCPAQAEPDAFGDQKYVEQMVAVFGERVSIGFPVVNTAAWNIGQEKLHLTGKNVTWRGQTIYIHHFQGLRLLGRGWIDLYSDLFPLSESVLQLIYRPYVRALRLAIRDIGEAAPDNYFEAPVGLWDVVQRLWLRIRGCRSFVRWTD